ncbi:MAG TPA: GMC oxidoreductase [Conexibacter sp.]|nr:GMC oxidoreductase [Conexibacter sp.]
MSGVPTYDVLLVGSGASGAMAAQTLGGTGLRVGVLDVGERDTTYGRLVPPGDFTTIRTTDDEQHAYFLGIDYEGVAWADNRVGSQLTPPRGHLVRGVPSRIPVVSETFFPLESLAYGGLGGGWGLGCFVFSTSELERAGLPAGPLREAYQVVADRIGISGARDDAARHCLGDLQRIQPAPPLEENLRGLLAAYERRRTRFNRQGFHLGRSALALLTEPKDGREPTSGNDMDFWSDDGRSAYRSWITMDALRAEGAVEYLVGRLVTRFEERADSVAVEAMRCDGSGQEQLRARRLVLAPGALGTARIVLRSFGEPGRALPLLSNPYTYMPCVQPRMLGRAIAARKPSFSPLIMYHEPGEEGGEILQAAFFSYRSLLLFKLVREVPLGFRDARRIMHELLSSFTIAGVHHPDRGDPSRTVRLDPHADSPTGDALAADYRLSADEQRANDGREALLARTLRRLGCFPLKAIRTPHGASIHYGGTLPVAADGAPFTLDGSGRLAGTRRVYVADGSGLRYLPAKGITLTLMANAHRVAAGVLETMRDG